MGKIRTVLSNSIDKVKSLAHNAIDTVRRDLDAANAAAENEESRMETLFFNDGFHALTAYRISRKLQCCGKTRLAHAVSLIAKRCSGIYISPDAEIGKDVAINIAPILTVEADAVIYDGVTLNLDGVKIDGVPDDEPVGGSSDVSEEYDNRLSELESRVGALEAKRRKKKEE